MTESLIIRLGVFAKGAERVLVLSTLAIGFVMAMLTPLGRPSAPTF